MIELPWQALLIWSLAIFAVGYLAGAVREYFVNNGEQLVPMG